MRKQGLYFVLWIVVLAFFISLWTGKLVQIGEMERLNNNIFSSAEFREQNMDEEMFAFLKEQSQPGKYVGIYLLESKFGYQHLQEQPSAKSFLYMSKKWKTQKNWHTYKQTMESIWDDVKYFPVAESISNQKLNVSYVNTWMNERTYGGNRGHEGCDLMAEKNERGLYPILSTTDGVVEKKGWLEKGGYRIGIRTKSGVYFYYAHLFLLNFS